MVDFSPRRKWDFRKDTDELSRRVLEVLNFIQIEFLRVWPARGISNQDLPNALASLGISAIDSAKAAVLLTAYNDLQNSTAMLRRFADHFALMLYFALCDDGAILKRWFTQPRLVLSQKNHKFRSKVSKAADGIFKRNPLYNFKDEFDLLSKGSVHPTWRSSELGACLAAGRYGALNPEALNCAPLGRTLACVKGVHLLGTVGPSISCFLDFLDKNIFEMPEFKEASPGKEYLQQLDKDFVRWYLRVSPLVAEFEKQYHLGGDSQ